MDIKLTSGSLFFQACAVLARAHKAQLFQTPGFVLGGDKSGDGRPLFFKVIEYAAILMAGGPISNVILADERNQEYYYPAMDRPVKGGRKSRRYLWRLKTAARLINDFSDKTIRVFYSDC